MKNMSDWILTKIFSYLTTNEGMTQESCEYTKTGMKLVMRDSMGYRYEIHVSPLSRINTEDSSNDHALVLNKA